MAKKVTKTKVKNTKKGSVTKTVTKSSKKGLIIGITVGALVLAGGGVAAGILIPKLLNKDDPTPTTKKASFELGDSSKQYGSLSLDKEKVYIVDISNQIGEKSFDIDFKPVAEYKDTDFIISLNVTNFTATYTKGSNKISVKGKDALKNKDKLVATFKEKPGPEPTEVATIALDSGSTDYGTLATTDISEHITEKKFSVGFTPKTKFEDRDFTVTITGASGFTATYDKDDSNISIVGANPLKNGDDLIVSLDLVELWTAGLDGDSKDFGDLYVSQEEQGDSVTIKEYIGLKSATISFIPSEAYKDIQFKVTASDTKGSTFEISYAKGTTASIAITSDKEFEDGDVVTLHFEVAYTLTFYDSDGSTVVDTIIFTETDTGFTFPSNGEKGGSWVSNDFRGGGTWNPGEEIVFYQPSDFDDFDFVWEDVYAVTFYSDEGLKVADRAYTVKAPYFYAPAYAGGGVWHNDELGDIPIEQKFDVPADKIGKNYDFVWVPNP